MTHDVADCVVAVVASLLSTTSRWSLSPTRPTWKVLALSRPAKAKRSSTVLLCYSQGLIQKLSVREITGIWGKYPHPRELNTSAYLTVNFACNLECGIWGKVSRPATLTYRRRGGGCMMHPSSPLVVGELHPCWSSCIRPYHQPSDRRLFSVTVIYSFTSLTCASQSVPDTFSLPMRPAHYV